MPVSSELSRSLARTFISKVDVADADCVHALLSKSEALRAAVKGEVGQQAVFNLDARIPSLEAHLNQTRAIQAQSRYPEAFEGAIQVDEKFLGGWRKILGEMQGLGTQLTDRLRKFVAG